ncbi:hypothetical protein BD410DRAFT_829282 [Rickenella mellea]|uniref:Uncharacterized protein n=1 Tax=Rickenella mellea TaxID=50990 RepID=A0A4Y7Q0A1_9AGAM|nr:hypothetical protein BD410DRAFT_829282 [Rickenella mellea]
MQNAKPDPGPAVLFAPSGPLSSTGSFDWWPYSPSSVDSSTITTSMTQPIFPVVPSSSLAIGDNSFFMTTTTSTTTSTPNLINISHNPCNPPSSHHNLHHWCFSPNSITRKPSTSSAAQSQTARKYEVQAIVLESLLGCVFGDCRWMHGWSRSRARILIGQRHFRLGAGGKGGGCLQPPNLSREPTRMAFTSFPNSMVPNPIANAVTETKRPVMTPAPTIFPSTASSYDYELDGDEEVYESARLLRAEDTDNGHGNDGKKRSYWKG